MIGCQDSTPQNNVTELYFPDLPSSCEEGGKFYKLPNKDLTVEQTKELVISLTISDRKNARANVSCRSYYHNLQKIYNKKNLPEFKG